MPVTKINGIDVEMGGRQLLSVIYPVGSIVISNTNNSPGTYLGGSWARIQDVFPYFGYTKHAPGVTGGEETHTLTTSEIPSHTHGERMHVANIGSRPLVGGSGTISGMQSSQSGAVEEGGAQEQTESAGGGSSHNNMPPYQSFYAWRRIS